MIGIILMILTNVIVFIENKVNSLLLYLDEVDNKWLFGFSLLINWIASLKIRKYHSE